MQSKFQANFATLSNEEAEYFADSISGAVSTNDDCDKEFDIAQATNGEELFNALTFHHIDHKTACMSLANDPSPMAIIILEKVVGKEIVRAVPKAAPAARVQRVKVENGPKVKLVKNDPRTIHNIKEGAKRPGSASYDRYMLYKEGMTVTEFIAAGGTAGDVKHDAGKGFITLKDPE